MQAEPEGSDIEENSENGEAGQQPELDRSENRESSKNGDDTIKQLDRGSKSNLKAILYWFTKEVTVIGIADVRKEFLANFETPRLSFGKENASPTRTFHPLQATQITDYIFTTVLGSDLPRRISALAAYYNSRSMRGMDSLASCRAMDLARDDQIPMALRTFYVKFARVQQQTLDQENPYSTLMKYRGKAALYDQWKQLYSKAASRDQELIRFLKAFGPTQDLRGGYRNNLKKYLCATLNIESPEKLQETMKAAEVIRVLVHRFGYGILVLLPSGADNR